MPRQVSHPAERASEPAAYNRRLEAGLTLAPGRPVLVRGRVGLVDEFGLFVYPVVLGAGTPLFPVMEKPLELELVETRTFGSRVVYLRYRRVREAVRLGREHRRMRLTAIKPGDIVQCNKKGRLFHAKVTGAGPAGTLRVQPLERNISYRHVTASEIADHWSHTVSTRRADRRPPTQLALDLEDPR